jgi:uncharacterized protein
MRLDLRDLRLRSGERYESVCGLDLAPATLGGVEYRVLLPEGATIQVERVAGGFLVRVSADANIYGPCARCLKEARIQVRAAEEEFAASAAGGWKESERSAFIEDLVVDVAGLTREAVLVALPEQMLCSSACKGLCAQCGHDLNEGPCGCEALEISQPMG